MRRSRALFALSLSLALAGAAQAAESLPFKMQAPIPGPDGGWDYASVGNDSHILFVARPDGVMAVNLDNGAVTPTLVPGKKLHGVIELPGGRAISSNGGTSSAVMFQISDGKIIAEFAAGAKPDAVVRDPKTGLVVVMNGDDGTATLIDTEKRSVAGTMSIGGKLEFAAADQAGHVFLNVEDKNELVVLDIPSRSVISRHAMPDCDGPSGLALDNNTHILLAVCGNKKAVALSAIDGHQIAVLPIGSHPDAAMVDEKGRRFLVPCGGDGTLTVIHEDDNGQLSVTASVPTARGARTGAYDAKTGHVYLPTADYGPAKEGERPPMLPGSFRILVLAPN